MRATAADIHASRERPADDDRSLRPLVVFLTIAMMLSVAYWVVRGAGSATDGRADEGAGIWGALRGYGPTIAALLAACLGRGDAGLRALGRRLASWRAPRALWLGAFALPIALVAIALAAVAIAGASPLDLAVPRGPRLLVAFFVFAIVDGPLGEEIGWRGYLLPLLLARTGPVAASVVVGLAWFAWHIPLYAADGRALDAAFLVTYFASVMAFAFVFTWFFVRSRGSVALAVLLHTTTNYFQYAAATLFPALRETVLDNRAFVVSLVMVAVVMAVSLRRVASRESRVASR